MRCAPQTLREPVELVLAIERMRRLLSPLGRTYPRRRALRLPDLPCTFRFLICRLCTRSRIRKRTMMARLRSLRSLGAHIMHRHGEQTETQHNEQHALPPPSRPMRPAGIVVVPPRGLEVVVVVLL